MSRAAPYPFLRADPEEAEAALIASYEDALGIAIQPGSPERLFISWLTSGITQLRAEINHAANQNLPSRAQGEALDALGELFYASTRPQAQAASCTVEFILSSILPTPTIIPAGTRITDASKRLVWEIASPLSIPAGSTAGMARAICQIEGAVGNGYAVGQINMLIDPLPYVSGARNITASEGGADVADDATYYALMRASQDKPALGTIGGYAYIAKSVSAQIADVAVNSPEAGKVAVYALMEGGKIAGEEIKSLILAACMRPDAHILTDTVIVSDPEAVSYDISLAYYIPEEAANSTAEIAAAVERAVEEYIDWQSARLGRDINPFELSKRLAQTGIKRAAITAPAFTALRDGRGQAAAPQVARIRAKSIVNGGYEAE